MLNPWNDLIKQETNNNVLVNNAHPQAMIYETDTSNNNNNVMLLGSGATVPNIGQSMVNNNNGMPPMDVQTGHIPSQAQVAAAVATAMMMQNQNNGINNANMSQMDDCMDDDDCGDSDDEDSSMNNDAEGVWSPDIEQSFQEALAIYPPCGRRKIILSEEGKMYGRNELIARYIKVRTGKSRSRKQVSSHIQVLAKRKTKDFHTTFKDEKTGKCTSNPGVGGFNNPFSHLTSAQIISPTPMPTQNGQMINNTNNHNNNSNMNNNNSNTQNQQNNQNVQNQFTMQHNTNPMNNNQNQQQIALNQQQQQQRTTLTNSHNTHNHHNQQHPQMLQNCTNILPNMNNNNMNSNNSLQSQSCIWSHPGLQPEKKARLDLSQNLPTSQPCSASSPTQLIINNNNNQNTDEIIPSSSSSSSSSSASSSSSVTNVHQHTMGQSASPESASPPTNQSLTWAYNKNESKSSNKCIMGLHQLRLVEFSGFLEQRNDPEIYNKHLFVHLNTSDYFLFNNYKNDSSNNTINNSELTDDFELINYKEFADKFPENDLLWSISNGPNNIDPKTQTLPVAGAAVNSAAYLIKFWVDLNYTLEENVSSLYAVTNIFESPEALSISCSTKVCSFGNQVVEKVETEHARYENGRCTYRIENSPMCEYMITFINKLKQLPEKNLKNSVLENFSVLQLIKNNDTQELLLTLAYVFEVSTSEHGAQHNVYKLTNK